MYVASFLLLIQPQPISSLFPYTTLFRSDLADHELERLDAAVGAALDPEGLPGAQRLEVEHSRQRADHLVGLDRKSTRLNSSHLGISYAVFCLKKKNETTNIEIRYNIRMT